MSSIPYFQHDSDMRNDPRIKALRNKYGAEGYTLYCFTLEYLTYNQCEDFQMTDLNLELLSGDFGMPASRIKDMYLYMVGLELFELNQDKIGSKKLKNRLEKIFIKREKWRLAKQQKSEKKEVSDEKTENSDEKTENSLGKSRKSIVDKENSKSILEKEGIQDTDSLESMVGKRDPNGKQTKKNIESDSDGFIPPTLDEIAKYCNSKNYPDYSEKFFSYFSANNWFVGKGKAKSKMKNWKLALETWHTNQAKFIIQNVFGKNSDFVDNAAAKMFVKKLICIAGIEETIDHLINLQKSNFKKILTMEEQTTAIEEIQEDGTVKTKLNIKPREDNGNRTNTGKQPNEHKGYFDPERLQADYEYFKKFERP